MRSRPAQLKDEQSEIRTNTQALSAADTRFPHSVATLLLSLQHTHGNSFVQRMLNGITIQRKCSCGGKCDDCMSDTARQEQSIARQILDRSGSGQPMELYVRSFMEEQFREDFSSVRIHTDSQSARMAQQLNALAFTVDRDIYFDSGQYQPLSQEGRRLLAHELTHVVQQSAQAPAVETSLRVSEPDDVTEKEADAIADTVVGRSPAVPVFSLSPREMKVKSMQLKAPKREINTGDVALVVGYLRGQVDNWHEGARQGCEEFWKWSRPKPGAGKDFWFNLAGNIIWAVGNTTTAGLIGIGIGAMQTYLSASISKQKAENAEKIYNEILTAINKARSEMTKEETLQIYAKKALAEEDILNAVREARVKDWAPRARSIANLPSGEDVNDVKSNTFTELLKQYWGVNVKEVEVVYEAYQSQPRGINIANLAMEDWPEIVKLIREGDTTWHIYKNKMIVGTQAGKRVEIPVDHPAREKVEALVRQLEEQTLK